MFNMLTRYPARITRCLQMYAFYLWHQLAAGRDCDLLLAATSSSAQLSRTLVPGHSP